MNTFDKFKDAEQRNDSLLCVGLDSTLARIPSHLGNTLESLLTFNRDVIEATKDLVSSYKINFAFYEQYGLEGIRLLIETRKMIPENIPVIADAKRGDIGNTSKAYAKGIFESMEFDAITVSPYMGKDSILPFLDYKDKMTIILCLTSNPGSHDFEKLESENKQIYKHVIEKTSDWGSKENTGYVVGATHPEEISELRDITNSHYFLIPGIGAQGGDPNKVMIANRKGPAIINSSRSIIYAGKDSNNYQQKVRETAEKTRESLKL